MKSLSLSSALAFVGLLVLNVPSAVFAAGGQWNLFGWNNLGMHCMDDDYSVFSILPPFNTFDAQLIDPTGKLVTNPAGLTVTYEAVADPDGSFNSTSVGKSNFWDYSQMLFGVACAPDTGLTGMKMPGLANVPQPMTWSSGTNWFEGAGVPVIPVDDAGRANTYPMMRLIAKDGTGTTLATTDIVVPVSAEMSCRVCHASTAGPAAQPAAGWVNDPNGKRDFRLNILRLHDQRQSSDPTFTAALASAGYDSNGLYATAVAGKAILCASCHASAALGASGFQGVEPLTQAMHLRHSRVTAPSTGMTLDASTNRAACYQCHPGFATRCLRGAMGSAVAQDGTMAMQCQSCHGSMSQVGSRTRSGWMDQPQCANCHTGSATSNNGQIRYTSALDSSGALRAYVNDLFATNPDTPAPGKSLYRYSKGHGGLQCEACHGSTHAEFPSSQRNDNLQSWRAQGHVGMLSDCSTCHATTPNTTNGGPHGMHPIGADWVRRHGDGAEGGDGGGGGGGRDDRKNSSGGVQQCTTCHGADLRGTVLSRVQGDRNFTMEWGARKFARGMEVSCYSCHDGPGGEGGGRHPAPAVAAARLQVLPGKSGTLSLTARMVGAVARITRQPMHGTVALNGLVATYIPEHGFTGPDFFTYLASDPGGYVDSAPATVSVRVGSFTALTDSDQDGIPDMLEYATGLSPSFSSPERVPAQKVETINGVDYYTLSVVRSIVPPDASIQIQVSGDKRIWTPAVILSNTPELLKARDIAKYSARTPRFMRVQVLKP